MACDGAEQQTLIMDILIAFLKKKEVFATTCTENHCRSFCANTVFLPKSQTFPNTDSYFSSIQSLKPKSAPLPFSECLENRCRCHASARSFGFPLLQF